MQPTEEAPFWQARKLLRAARVGTLATGIDGQPFASLVTPACAPDLSVLLLLSELSEHTKHLRAEPRCSLLVAGEPARPESANRAAADRHRPRPTRARCGAQGPLAGGARLCSVVCGFRRFRAVADHADGRAAGRRLRPRHPPAPGASFARTPAMSPHSRRPRPASSRIATPTTPTRWRRSPPRTRLVARSPGRWSRPMSMAATSPPARLCGESPGPVRSVTRQGSRPNLFAWPEPRAGHDCANIAFCDLDPWGRPR